MWATSCFTRWRSFSCLHLLKFPSVTCRSTGTSMRSPSVQISIPASTTCVFIPLVKLLARAMMSITLWTDSLTLLPHIWNRWLLTTTNISTYLVSDHKEEGSCRPPGFLLPCCRLADTTGLSWEVTLQETGA
uniref:Uncharacterized protein n=1 Tax=Pipistrellus kuhlii TaxID=59472 RepID=A0A7J7UGB1_PIPKU|nr:hypothetical protein mPipKuh1_009112 [Pipistrellus kuhlii]